MSLTLLLDLDDTLLDTNVDVFTPAYLQALVKHFNGRAAPDVIFRALATGTGLMNQNLDPAHTLQEVFDASFFPDLGVSTDILDLCAAPGGKLGYLAQLMSNKGHLVAYDVAAERLKLLEENKLRLGLNCEIMTSLESIGLRPNSGGRTVFEYWGNASAG